jgi:hypothetical protein
MTGTFRHLPKAGALALAVLACACDSERSPVRPPRTAASAAAPRQVETRDVSKSTVIVEADGIDADMATPWGSGNAWSRTMMGLVVQPRGILVGGWGLRGQKHVRVAKPGSSVKTPARLIVFDEDAGLALLTVDEAAFWTDLRPANLARDYSRAAQVRLLHANWEGTRVDSVAASLGGVAIYGGCDLVHLRIGQVDPKYVLDGDVIDAGGQVLGVVTARSGEVLALGANAIRDFLVDARKPTYRGFPVLGLRYRYTKGRASREELGLAETEGGILVSHVYPGGSGIGALIAGDVLLTIDGGKVDRDGSYDLAGVGRIPFTGAIPAGHHPGDVVSFGVLRDGRRQSVKVTLRSWPGSTRLVPWFGPVDPSNAYVIEGGLVFENLTGEYLRSYGDDFAAKVPTQLIEAWYDRWDATPQRPGVVVLARVLADPATLGYQRLRDLVVEQVNGKPVHSVRDVTAAFAHPSGPYHYVTLAAGQPVRRIVLDVQEAKAANERLKATYMPAESAGDSSVSAQSP